MSYRSVGPVVVAVMAATGWTVSLEAQSQPKAHWLMDGYDKERTSWQRNETLISPATVGGMKLIWKLKLDNQPRQMHNLFPPLIVGDVQTATGRARSPSSRASPTTSTASTSRRGTQIWKRHFDSTFDGRRAAAAARSAPAARRRRRSSCRLTTPGKYKVYAISWDGRLRTLDRGHRRGDRARRAVSPAQRQALRA